MVGVRCWMEEGWGVVWLRGYAPRPQASGLYTRLNETVPGLFSSFLGVGLGMKMRGKQCGDTPPPPPRWPSHLFFFSSLLQTAECPLSMYLAPLNSHPPQFLNLKPEAWGLM